MGLGDQDYYKVIMARLALLCRVEMPERALSIALTP